MPCFADGSYCMSIPLCPVAVYSVSVSTNPPQIHKLKPHVRAWSDTAHFPGCLSDLKTMRKLYKLYVSLAAHSLSAVFNV